MTMTALLDCDLRRCLKSKIVVYPTIRHPCYDVTTTEDILDHYLPRLQRYDLWSLEELASHLQKKELGKLRFDSCFLL
jgi:hypothetical protein